MAVGIAKKQCLRYSPPPKGNFGAQVLMEMPIGERKLLAPFLVMVI